MINPHNDRFTDTKTINKIRTYLILLYATLIPKFNFYKTCSHTYSTQTSSGKIKIDYNDYTEHNRFVLLQSNNFNSIELATKFQYFNPNHGIPYLGSATTRKHDPELTLLAKQYATECIEKHENAVQIFTDGSVRGHSVRTAGAGFVCVQNNQILHKNKIPVHKNSIQIAELTAIYSALDTVLENKLIYTNNKNIAIFCDNKYVVNILNNKYNSNKKHSTLCDQTQQLLFKCRQNRKVEVMWIPAHCDVFFHDQADKLAVQAAIDLSNEKKP